MSSLLITSVTAANLFAAVAVAVARRHTDHQDDAVRGRIVETEVPGGEAVAEAAGPLGKEWLHVPATAALSVYLYSRGAGVRAPVPVIASLAAEGLSRVLDHTPPHRTVPPGHPSPGKASFPSGHANETTAVALATAYVLAREGLVRGAPALTTALLVSVISALGRLYLDRHWVSDAVGGTLLGLSIAAACGALYETVSAASTTGCSRGSAMRSV